LLKILINSNIYISSAAVFLAMESQIQAGMKPAWHPYLALIFLATLFEYNFHRLIKIIKKTNDLDSTKYEWARENRKLIYFLVLSSFAGLILTAFQVQVKVLIALSPVALLTFLYSMPFNGWGKKYIRIREIPYLKIFLVAFVWTFVTGYIPLLQSGYSFGKSNISIISLERFIFVFAIAVPFDIRDSETDAEAGLKTIPLLFSNNTSYLISYISLMIFLTVSYLHYFSENFVFVFLALAISVSTTFIFLKNKAIRKLPYYYNGILDGALLLQGLMVYVFYFIRIPKIH
jgi:4-hydroxybenzoate polyprenyltransferase